MIADNVTRTPRTWQRELARDARAMYCCNIGGPLKMCSNGGAAVASGSLSTAVVFDSWKQAASQVFGHLLA
jgi:hypothetical protein